MKISALLLMSGVGKRFDSFIPKQFHLLMGKRVYLYALETFIQSNFFNEIILVCEESWIKIVKKEVKDFSNVKVVKGGNERKNSSKLGLLACSKDTQYVLIHDAARPFVTIEILEKNIEAAKKYKAVNTCIPCTDTLVYSPNGQWIESIPNRSTIYRGQTPQTFEYSLILAAHKQAEKNSLENITDDCFLITSFKHPVYIVEGDAKNLKITTPLDLIFAENIVQAQQKLSPPVSTKILTDKIFAVIGAKGGIGQSICDLLKKENTRVIEISRSTKNYHLDLSQPKTIKLCFEKIFQDFGPIDGLINCAGLLIYKPLKTLSLKEINQMLQVNFFGVIQSCKYAKIKKGGHIVNISSSSFSSGRKNYGIYSSAKAGVVNFTQGLALEFPDLFIYAAVPHRTNTSMRTSCFNDHPEELLDPKKVAEKILNILRTSSESGKIIEIK